MTLDSIRNSCNVYLTPGEFTFVEMFHLVNVVEFIRHFTIQPVLQQLAVVCRPFGSLKINTLIWKFQIRIAAKGPL